MSLIDTAPSGPSPGRMGMGARIICVRGTSIEVPGEQFPVAACRSRSAAPDCGGAKATLFYRILHFSSKSRWLAVRRVFDETKPFFRSFLCWINDFEAEKRSQFRLGITAFNAIDAARHSRNQSAPGGCFRPEEPDWLRAQRWSFYETKPIFRCSAF